MDPSSQRPASPPAAPWALLWLGAIAAGAWLPLLLVDQQPRGALQANASPPFLPTPLTTRSHPLLAPIPGIASDSGASFGPAPRPRASERFEPRTWIASSPESAPAPSPLDAESLLPRPIQGAVLLGGPLGLDSLNEKPMVPAARLEQALRARSTDRLDAVPPTWRAAMRALLQGPDRVLPAEVVRLPAPHLTTPEEYPLVMKADGVAETTVTPPHRSKQALERWARKATLPPTGSAKPLLLVLEPIPPEPPSANPQSQSYEPLSRINNGDSASVIDPKHLIRD